MNILARTSRSSAVAGACGTVVGLVLLAGCGGNGLQTTHTAADSSLAGSSATSPGPSGGPSPSTARSSGSGSAGTSAASPATGHDAADTPTTSPSAASVPSSATSSTRICGLAELSIGERVPRGAGTAGSNYVLLTFHNDSASTCSIDGHPGVSFVGKGNGTQLGAPAARTTPSTPRVLLRPGDTTTALLRITDAGNYDPEQCAPTTSDGFRIYPPDSRTAAFVPFRTQACQRSLGTEPQLTVSPVGLSA